MRLRSRRSFLARLLPLLLAASIVAACGDDDPPASPSPPPGTSGSAALSIENFTATSTPGAGGTFNYRASLRLRETGGGAATLTGLSLTLTQTSGVTVTREVTAAEAFPATTVAANGTLDSNTLSVSGAPIQASQLAVRITFTGTGGTTGTVQATANVTGG
jgi:hypothetical protein